MAAGFSIDDPRHEAIATLAHSSIPALARIHLERSQIDPGTAVLSGHSGVEVAAVGTSVRHVPVPRSCSLDITTKAPSLDALLVLIYIPCP